MRPLVLLMPFACWLGASHLVLGQQNASEVNDKVQVTVEQIGHADNGDLVLKVRIHAKATESLFLISNPKTADPAHIETMKPFSLMDSYLVDFYSGNKITALATLPNKPFYGSMSLIFRLDKGEWIEMGVAFPKPPPPPPDKDGKPQDYKFTLHVGISPDPVPITYPAGA